MIQRSRIGTKFTSNQQQSPNFSSITATFSSQSPSSLSSQSAAECTDNENNDFFTAQDQEMLQHIVKPPALFDNSTFLSSKEENCFESLKYNAAAAVCSANTHRKQFYELIKTTKTSNNEIEQQQQKGTATTTYVCCLSVIGFEDGDIDLNFSERVKLLNSCGNFALVQVMQTGLVGYVPMNCLLPLDQFLSDIKYLRTTTPTITTNHHHRP
jgi:hypothetical protein